MPRPLILLSNDDGFRAEGLQSLLKSLRRFARVVVVAPEGEQSTTSHSLTLHRPLRIRRQEKDVYSVDGTPTDCILLGVHEILKRRPDLVASGINHGPNLGDDVHYSGTVAAALEGGLMGIRAVAFSLARWDKRRPVWSGAVVYATQICRRILKGELPQAAVLNVNIPNRARGAIRGLSFTKLGKRNYGEVIFRKTDPHGRPYFWIGGDQRGFKKVKGSDCDAILAGRVSVTPLQLDLTDHALLKMNSKV